MNRRNGNFYKVVEHSSARIPSSASCTISYMTKKVQYNKIYLFFACFKKSS